MRTRAVVGGYEVLALLDGVQDLGSPGGMVDEFLSPSNEAWDAYRTIYPQLFGARGGWRLTVRASLIRDETHTIVFDTGVGPDTAPANEWFGAPGLLPQELAAAEVALEDVETVVISHVHDDHIGGTCNPDGQPAFPNARYLIHRADIDWIRAQAEISDEDKAIWTLLLEPVVSNGQLVEVDDAFEVAPGIRTRHLPGHTPGHQGLELASGAESVFLTADSFNHPAQLDHADWAGISDNDPDEATERRRVLLKELLDSGRLIAPSHLAEPFGRVVMDGDRVVWRPA